MIDLERIIQIDKDITLAINGINGEFSDAVMCFFSDKIVWIPMYAGIIALMLWKLGWKKTLVVLCGVVLTVVLCDQSSNIVKHFVQRLRPVNDPSMVARGLHILERGGGYSFFSAHAANSFGIALCTIIPFCKYAGTCWSRSYTAWMLVWAAMVSISRVFVGKHFLGDVIVGAIVGTLIGLCLGTLVNLAIRRSKI